MRSERPQWDSKRGIRANHGRKPSTKRTKTTTCARSQTTRVDASRRMATAVRGQLRDSASDGLPPHSTLTASHPRQYGRGVRIQSFPSRSAALVMLTAFVLGMPQGILVVCVGTDGRISVEISSSEPLLGNSDVMSRGLAEAQSPCSCSGRCGPCHDSEIGLEDMAFHLPSVIGHHAPRPVQIADALPGQESSLWRDEANPRRTSSASHLHSPPRPRSVILRV